MDYHIKTAEQLGGGPAPHTPAAGTQPIPIRSTGWPVPLTGPSVASYFDNLLPGSPDIRKRLSHKFSSGTRAMDLLEKIGRDCVDAVQLLPPDMDPPDVHHIGAEPLTDAQVKQLLDHTLTDPAPGMLEDEELRISIAGAQEKTALLRHQNQWCKPLDRRANIHNRAASSGNNRTRRSTNSTKQCLLREMVPGQLLFSPLSYYSEHDIDLRLDVRAVSVDLSARELESSSGERICYHKNGYRNLVRQ